MPYSPIVLPLTYESNLAEGTYLRIDEDEMAAWLAFQTLLLLLQPLDLLRYIHQFLKRDIDRRIWDYHGHGAVVKAGSSVDVTECADRRA